jgi:hypothetical protein
MYYRNNVHFQLELIDVPEGFGALEMFAMRVPPTEAMESCTRYRTVSALVHPVAT